MNTGCFFDIRGCFVCVGVTDHCLGDVFFDCATMLGFVLVLKHGQLGFLPSLGAFMLHGWHVAFL
jgi:hypothetical protein